MHLVVLHAFLAAAPVPQAQAPAQPMRQSSPVRAIAAQVKSVVESRGLELVQFSLIDELKREISR